jgi:hypothetical protein
VKILKIPVSSMAFASMAASAASAVSAAVELVGDQMLAMQETRSQDMKGDFYIGDHST